MSSQSFFECPRFLEQLEYKRIKAMFHDIFMMDPRSLEQAFELLNLRGFFDIVFHQDALDLLQHMVFSCEDHLALLIPRKSELAHVNLLDLKSFQLLLVLLSDLLDCLISHLSAVFDFCLDNLLHLLYLLF